MNSSNALTHTHTHTQRQDKAVFKVLVTFIFLFVFNIKKRQVSGLLVTKTQPQTHPHLHTHTHTHTHTYTHRHMLTTVTGPKRVSSHYPQANPSTENTEMKEKCKKKVCKGVKERVTEGLPVSKGETRTYESLMILSHPSNPAVRRKRANEGTSEGGSKRQEDRKHKERENEREREKPRARDPETGGRLASAVW